MTDLNPKHICCYLKLYDEIILSKNKKKKKKKKRVKKKIIFC